MENNNFSDGSMDEDARERQGGDLSASHERDSDPYGGLWASLSYVGGSIFHGNATISHQQPFTPTRRHLIRQSPFDLQNSQIQESYSNAEMNASSAMLPLEHNIGHSDLHGASNMTPSIDRDFQYGRADNNLFARNTANDSRNSGLRFTHNTSFNHFTTPMTHIHGRNNRQQSHTIPAPSSSSTGFGRNNFQSRSQPHLNAPSVGQMPGPSFMSAPAPLNMFPSLLPHSRDDFRSRNTEPNNNHKYRHEHEDNTFTLPDSGFSHFITPNPHIGRIGFEQAASSLDTRTHSRRDKPKAKKIARSRKTVTKTKPAALTAQENYLSHPESRQTSQEIDQVNELPPARTPVDNNEESEYENAPPKKTRKTRKAKAKVFIAKDSAVVPTLRMANNEVTGLLYLKGGGIREPLPEKNESGLFFETYENSRDGVATLNWMPPEDDATVPKDDEELRPYVMNLREAMKDMSAYIGRPGSKMRNRWLPVDWKEGDQPKEGDVLQNPYYPESWLERRAWDIAKACQRLHLEGPGFINCLDPLLLENSFDFKDLTFKERMERLVATCKHCKDRVAAMLKLGMGAIYQYLLAPEDLVKASKGNRTNNDIRQTRLKESAKKRKRNEEK